MSNNPNNSGFYYLQSRFYDPKLGRFINADGEISSTLDCGANLFSYCNNNPISLVDSEGNRPVVGLDPNKETAEERHMACQSVRQNSSRSYIYGQAKSEYSDMSFGVSTVGKNGCGAVACYNALTMTGRDVQFETVRDSFEEMFLNKMGYSLYGLLGISTLQVKIFLYKQDIEYKLITNIDEFKAIDSPGVFIMRYWNTPAYYGQHYVAMQYYGNNKYLVYNQYSLDEKPRSASGINSVVKDDWRFINAFFIPQ